MSDEQTKQGLDCGSKIKLAKHLENSSAMTTFAVEKCKRKIY